MGTQSRESCNAKVDANVDGISSYLQDECSCHSNVVGVTSNALKATRSTLLRVPHSFNGKEIVSSTFALNEFFICNRSALTSRTNGVE